MTNTNEIRIGIIGLGFMGRTHLAAYRSAIAAGANARIAAVADPNIERALAAATGNLSTGTAPDLNAAALARLIDGTERFSDAGRLIASGSVDVVSICTPTDTHVDLAIAAIKAGVHVLVEKPVATRSADVARLIGVAREHPRILVMPAMCMRFWPGWPWLKEKIDAARTGGGEWGRFIGVTFQRLGSGPTWSKEFYADATRSGGALVDLHIHDADFALWCFGAPLKVTCVGTLDHCTTMYRFSGEHAPAHIVAQGGWNHAPGFPFTMRYTALFEGATAVFDLADPISPLRVYRANSTDTIDLPGVNGYEAEAAHMLAAIVATRNGEPVTLRATLDDAMLVTKVLEAERQSQLNGGCQLV